MSNVKTIAQEMHEALAQSLLNRIKSGEATAAELSVARQFLKDNHIDADGEKNETIRSIAHDLPDLDTDNVVMN